ncbi:MAG: dTMP kinase [Dehalococcoidia bacterium]|nr:dTMP kinase [Dehalococcoidia bacterium]
MRQQPVAGSPGRFITFEGGEGSGKSTQAASLAEVLERRGVPVLLSSEPRGTEFGRGAWQLLASGVAPESELFLFVAARAHHVRTLIQPAIAAGKVVICDRYSDSTVAYQEFGRGLDGDLVRRACAYAEGGVQPDLTFLLDLPADAGLRRKGKAANDDAISAAGLAFHERVRAGYLALAREDPARIGVIGAGGSREDTAAAVLGGAEAILQTREQGDPGVDERSRAEG